MVILQAVLAAEKLGYPVMLKAMALGGVSSTPAENKQELTTYVEAAFAHTSQIVIHKYDKLLKELEFEVLRDEYDNCVIVST